MFWKRLRSYFFPSPAGLTLIWVALFELGVFSAFSTLFSFTTLNWSDGILLWSFSAVPIAALLLLIAALRENRSGPRAVLWALITLLQGLAGLVFALSLILGTTEGARQSSIAFLVCCIPFVLISLAITVIFTFKARPELQKLIRSVRYQRILEMIQVRGECMLAEVAGELSMPVEQALTLLMELITNGELMAFFDPVGNRVYSVAALAEKHRLLLGVVQARGQMRLADLAAELHAPEEMIHQWIYDLVKRGRFHGFVDWEKGVLYSRESDQLTGLGRCPHCGGELNLAGQGVIRCNSCGVEIFL